MPTIWCGSAAIAQLRAIYRQAALCLLDSRVVAGLARLCGLPAPPVVPGSDLTDTLLQRHVQPGERITIVGLAPRWLPALIARFALAPPAHFDPPMGFDRDPRLFAETIAFVRANPARFVFLAVGSPRQERLAAALAEAGGASRDRRCASAPAWSSSPARSGARRGSCSVSAWNGCSGLPSNPGGCPAAI